MKIKKNVLSVEVCKYPFYGKSDQNEDYFSEKICCYTLKLRKKIVRKTKWVFFYGHLIFSFSNGLAPTQAIGLPILPTTPLAIHSNADLSKEAIIAQVVQQMPAEIDFTQKELNELYRLSVEYKNNSLSKEELITQISNLRGGDFIDIIAAIGVMGAIIIVLTNSWGLAFQPNPQALVPPHLQWLYGNNGDNNQFGYGPCKKQQSSTIVKMTQNAGSENEEPSSGSWDYKKVMEELKCQSGRRNVKIEIGNQLYTIKNPDRGTALELSDMLAHQIYDSIRECDTDISDIANNLMYKGYHIKQIKDHVFYNKHHLDRYDTVEYKRFDPDLHQALAWKRLELGIHTKDDITWLKHEYTESYHELKFNTGYSEAHDRAQRFFNGAPWNSNNTNTTNNTLDN